MKTAELSPAEVIYSNKLELTSGRSTNVYAARYAKDRIKTSLVVFDQPTKLLHYCENRKITDAINGGFTMFHRDPRPTKLLGTHVLNGQRLDSVPFVTPKSGVKLDQTGELSLYHVADPPDDEVIDFFEAGPMIVLDGVPLTTDEYDYEGVSSHPLQMDDDWTRNRFPRAAIGTDEDYLYTVSCDGYSPVNDSERNSGLTLNELAEFMQSIGVIDGLNLDGGSKATHIVNGNLLNNPRGGTADYHRFFRSGLPIMSALIFEATQTD